MSRMAVLRTPNRPAKSRARGWVGQIRMFGTWVSYFRSAAGLAHTPVSLNPRRKRFFGLIPMRHRSFIAPIKKVGHRSFVRARRHKSTHIFFAVPCCHGPEGPMLVSKKGALLESRRPPYLPDRLTRIHHEEWDES